MTDRSAETCTGGWSADPDRLTEIAPAVYVQHFWTAKAQLVRKSAIESFDWSIHSLSHQSIPFSTNIRPGNVAILFVGLDLLDCVMDCQCGTQLHWVQP